MSELILFEHYPESMLLIDSSGRILDANRKALELYEIEKAELLKLDVFSLSTEEYREPVYQMLEIAVFEEKVVEIVHLSWTGKPIPVEVKIKPLFISDSRIILFYVKDISIRQQMQVKNDRLQYLNSVYVDIFMHMPDGAIIVNPQGKIKEVNLAAQSILGQSLQEMQGKSVSEYLGMNIPHIQAMLENGESYRDVELLIPGQERNLHAVISGIPFRSNGVLRGGVIYLSPIEKIHHLVNRFTGARASYSFQDIITVSHSMQEAIHLAKMAASSTSNVLLEGESGTGKEVFAQAIHSASQRKNGPFVAVNCGAIPRELIGSELFGYIEGAFTGARKGGSPGKFELASGGTLFLDEIGDMPLEQQVTLLRVLQEKNITRIGDSRTIPVDVRVICATNKNLWQEVEAGNFRADLYYRLNVINIDIPPLRRRKEDIIVLFDYFLSKIPAGKAPLPEERINIEESLQQYRWPGNIRELQNVVERMVHMAGTLPVGVKHLPPELRRSVSETVPGHKSVDVSEISIYEARGHHKKVIQEQERDMIISLLKHFQGNISKVAREMGVNRSTIYRKMKVYKIEQ
ncbi:transcriptional regulatory protein zrar [hydrocarbon metagenome]|uniref:Transcriptional regulatory protein zrar n=1 Tax=hydrocarbon metagenome TaxID=938273 RepID=A0A0W8E174_9ZZZZ